ncbi:MAG: hypothetical protein FWF53_07170 [Candidatus Azobacteroides sp.]|nr:hypothetical protein [Candidatus Azobacteroides sp.]
MKERLIEFLAYLKIGQKQFEIKAGLSNGYVDKLGDNITLKSLNKIETAYPELNINWLKTGEGDMVKSTVNQNNVEGDNIQGNNVTVNKSQTDKFLDLLKASDDQLSKSQEQIDRLIGLLEKLNKL